MIGMKIHSLAFIVVLLKTVIGCGRKEATAAPPLTTTPVPPPIIIEHGAGNETMENISVPTKSHKLPCPTSHATYCLHGGTCFVVYLQGTPEFSCHCPQARTGLRCEEEIIIFVGPIVPYAAQSALIAIGIILVLVVGLAILGFYVYKRYQKKEKDVTRRASDEGAAENNQEMMPMNKDVENGTMDHNSHKVEVDIADHNNDLLLTEKPTEL